MVKVANPQAMKDYVGKELGVSEWIDVDQAMIDAFADATGDHQWIHVDVERAKTELPGGKTIAHGYLTLSLLPRMMYEIYEIVDKSHGLNYGSNKVRFTNPVPAGSRVRGKASCKACEDVKGDGVRIINEFSVEIEGQERPALIAEVISLVYP